MNEFQAMAIMVGLFALRFILPIALMIAIGYAMNRLAGRWEAEEKSAEAAPPIPLPVVPSSVRAARPTAAALNVPCWAFKNCDAATRARCPAYQQPSVACWVALLRAEGRLPAKCAGCERYTGMPALAAGD